MSFLAGFLGATLVGLAATGIARLLAGIQAAIAQMNSPPKPALHRIPGADMSGLGTNPDVSPIQVLNQGCLTIFVNLLLMTIIVAGVGMTISYIPRDALPREMPEQSWVGILYAGLLGILLRTLFWNWGVIVNLYNLMVNPPNPSLKSAEPPNHHYVAAKPPQSPQQVVAGGCLQIIARVILQLVLLAILIFSTQWVLHYLFG
jgi:hypothetical protein